MFCGSIIIVGMMMMAVAVLLSNYPIYIAGASHVFGGSITIIGLMMMAVAVLLSNNLHLHCRCNSCVLWQYHYRRYNEVGGVAV